jgi:hypothetical protein
MHQEMRKKEIIWLHLPRRRSQLQPKNAGRAGFAPYGARAGGIRAYPKKMILSKI